MIFLRQSTASQEVEIGKFVDDTDFKTAETGLTIANTDVKLHKHGGTTQTNKNSGGATHIAAGWYYVVLDATDTDTIGNLTITVDVAGALSVVVRCVVLDEAVYDVLFGTTAPSTYAGADTSGTTTLLSRIGGALTITSGRVNADLTHIAAAAVSTSTAQLGVNVVNFGGSAGTFASGRPAVNASYIGGVPVTATTSITFPSTCTVATTTGAVGSVTGNVGGNVTGSVGSVASGGITAASLASDTITAAKIASDAITAAKLAADCITAAKIANGAIDAATFAADVDAEILSYLVDDATRIDASALNTAAGTTIPDMSTLLTGIQTTIGIPNGVNLVADIAAIHNEIGADGLNLTAIPWNAAWDAEVQSECADALAAYDPPTKAELDVLGTAALATQASVDAVDNFVDTEVAAIKAVTDKLDTALELDGSVYRYTANALEQAPSGGGGGSTDWTADERTAIRSILGIPGSGTTPADPSAGILDTIRDAVGVVDGVVDGLAAGVRLADAVTHGGATAKLRLGTDDGTNPALWIETTGSVPAVLIDNTGEDDGAVAVRITKSASAEGNTLEVAGGETQIAAGDIVGNLSGSVGSVLAVGADAIGSAAFAVTCFLRPAFVGYIASSASATTATLDSSASSTDDVYNGAWLVHQFSGQAQLITDYVGVTKTATLSPGWVNGAVPSTGSFNGLCRIEAAPTPAATRANLATELGRIDAAVSTRLAPTTAGRTLDVTATGAAGIDWGNVENQDAGVVLENTEVFSSGVAGVVSVGSIEPNTITAAALAADAVAEIQSGLATAAALATVAGYVDTEVAAIKAKTDTIPTFPTNFAALSITSAGVVSADVKAVNAVTLQGVGTSGNAWRPA